MSQHTQPSDAASKTLTLGLADGDIVNLDVPLGSTINFEPSSGPCGVVHVYAPRESWGPQSEIAAIGGVVTFIQKDAGVKTKPVGSPQKPTYVNLDDDLEDAIKELEAWLQALAH